MIDERCTQTCRKTTLLFQFIGISLHAPATLVTPPFIGWASVWSKKSEFNIRWQTHKSKKQGSSHLSSSPPRSLVHPGLSISVKSIYFIVLHPPPLPFLLVDSVYLQNNRNQKHILFSCQWVKHIMHTTFLKKTSFFLSHFLPHRKKRVNLKKKKDTTQKRDAFF